MINKAMILGRVGKKEYKETKNGGWICKLSIATNKKYTDKSGVKHEQTNWHNVNFFGRLSDVANRFAHVGDLIFIEGEINNFESEVNGEKKMLHSIVGTDIKLLPNSKKEKAEVEGNKLEDFERPDDIPF